MKKNYLLLLLLSLLLAAISCDTDKLEEELLRVDRLYKQDLRQQALSFYVEVLSKQKHLNKVLKIYESLLANKA
jgi:hypothetical protein